MNNGPRPDLRGSRSPVARARRARLREFADLLADEVEPSLAAKRMGLSVRTGRLLLREICASLGPQAC
jgi:hypothetical protein